MRTVEDACPYKLTFDLPLVGEGLAPPVKRATNGRPYKTKSIFTVENPAVFAVLFEAAKA